MEVDGCRRARERGEREIGGIGLPAGPGARRARTAMRQRVGHSMDTHCRKVARDCELDRIWGRKERGYRINTQIQVAWAGAKLDWVIMIVAKADEARKGVL